MVVCLAGARARATMELVSVSLRYVRMGLGSSCNCGTLTPSQTGKGTCLPSRLLLASLPSGLLMHHLAKEPRDCSHMVKNELRHLLYVQFPFVQHEPWMKQ